MVHGGRQKFALGSSGAMVSASMPLASLEANGTTRDASLLLLCGLNGLTPKRTKSEGLPEKGVTTACTLVRLRSKYRKYLTWPTRTVVDAGTPSRSSRVPAALVTMIEKETSGDHAYTEKW